MIAETESQNHAIRRHLEDGKSITPIEALNFFRCFKLNNRIHDLRRDGMPILTTMVKRGKKRFASYTLIKP
jgi:hypothetical protein